MSISVVQSAASSTITSITFASVITAGNSVLLNAYMYTTSGSAISTSNPLLDGNPITGAILVSHGQSAHTNGAYLGTWLLPNLPAGSTLSLTIVQNIESMTALEISGLGSSPTVNLLNAAVGDSTTPSSGSIGPVSSVPCIVMGSAVGFAATQNDPGAPWTFIPDGDSGFGALGYQLITSGGNSYTWAVTQQVLADWAANIIAVSASTGAAGASMAFLGFFP